MSSPQPFNGCMNQWLRPGNLEGFNGIVKKLWEDFHVREIGLDGSICQLSHLVSANEIRASRIGVVEHQSGKALLPPGGPFELSADQTRRLKEEAFLSDKDIAVLSTFINTMLKYDVRAMEANAEDIADEEDGGSPAVKKVLGVFHPEDAKQLYRKAHCYLVGDVHSYSSQHEEPQALKTMRSQMHEVIRNTLPFLNTETQVTSDAFESQNPPGATFSAQVDFNSITNGETREAMAIRRVFLPADLRTRVQSVEVSLAVLDDHFTTEELPTVPSDDETESGRNGRPDDKLRFMRITLRPACVALLLGQSLSNPHLLRNAWSESRWPKGQPSYLKFNMFKSNRDTAEAIAKVAEAIGCRSKIFSFAGTKDRRGCTVQQVTVYKVQKDQLLFATTKKDWDRGIRVSDLEYVPKKLRLGDLKGNNFKLVIRDVDIEASGGPERIGALCDSLKQRGFINYFGLQRFGTKTIRTQDVGAALLAHKHERAVRLILGDLKEHQKWLAELRGESLDSETFDSLIKEDEGLEPATKKLRIEDGEVPVNGISENSYNYAPRYYLEENDIDKALSHLATWHHLERAILQSLKREPSSFIPALQQLPRSSLALYYHAAQSLIWNAAVGMRIEKFGAEKVVVGDLVRLGGPPVVEGEQLEAVDKQIEEETEEAGEESVDPQTEELAAYEQQWFGVTEIKSEAEAAEYSIFDVVLPLPGSSVQYPSNMEEEYNRLPQELLGVSLADFKDDNRHRLVKLAGNYRTMIEKVEDFDFEILRGDEFEHDRPILATDNDRLLGRSISRRDHFTCGLKPLQCALDTPLDDPANDVKPNVSEDEKRLGAVLISCSLPRSSYLTVAVRELLSEAAINGFTDRGGAQKSRSENRGGGRGGREGGRGGRGGRGRGGRGNRRGGRGHGQR